MQKFGMKIESLKARECQQKLLTKCKISNVWMKNIHFLKKLISLFKQKTAFRFLFRTACFYCKLSYKWCKSDNGYYFLSDGDSCHSGNGEWPAL